MSNLKKIVYEKLNKNNFFDAVRIGDLNQVKRHLEKGVNLNAKIDLENIKIIENNTGLIHGFEYKNCTALHIAALYSKFDMLKFLVGHGIDVYAKSENNYTATHIAARHGNLECLKYLFEICEREKLDRILYSAVLSGNNECVRFLINRGVDINEHEPNGETALHRAVIKGNLECVKFLLENGADYDIEWISEVGVIFNGKHNVLTLADKFSGGTSGEMFLYIKGFSESDRELKKLNKQIHGENQIDVSISF